MAAFEEARVHITDALSAGPADAALVVQLGDVGTGATSGTPVAFARARDYLAGFPAPASLITGNHDLEGPEFETDEANLAAWRVAFGQSHHWCRDVGPCVLVGLSTTRYRSNVLSHHEVHVDAVQLEWFRGVLRDVAPGKPVLVFTHAPPMGCGLKVLHGLHIKNRCGWLNHSTNPHAFLDIVAQHGRVKAWFSGHFHLSQNYADSITTAAGCLFVQTGVIGPHAQRDGHRQSRLVRATVERCQVWTVDHEDGGRRRLDADFSWHAAEAPAHIIPEDEMICDVARGYLCARDACSVLWHEGVTWWTVGPATLLAEQDGMLVEYDMATFAPVGCVALDTRGADVVLRDAGGMDVTNDVPGDGSCVARIELRDEAGSIVDTFDRNAWGSFFQVWQPNKWQLKRKQLQEGMLVDKETIMQ